MIELTVFSAMTIGLLGSSHCLGMCGGLGSLLGISSEQPSFLRLLSYNIGRLFTYTSIGALVGLLGEQLLGMAPQLGVVFRILAGALLIAMGLYISQWWMGLTRLEQWGAKGWAYIQPLTRYILPVRSHTHALLLGMVWGLLPCGLVYSTLSWALATAHWQHSALLMLAFGLGTLPVMLFIGFANQQLMKRLKSGSFRALAGGVVIAMGGITMLTPILHSSAHEHSQSEPAVHHHHSFRTMIIDNDKMLSLLQEQYYDCEYFRNTFSA